MFSKKKEMRHRGGMASGAGSYVHLLAPIEVGGRTLRNRIVKTAAGSRYWSLDGFVTDRVKALFDKTSAGGAALVSVDTMSFMPWKDAKFTMGGVFDNKFIPGLRELTDIIHANGALAMAQLHQAGPADFQDPIGPSRLTEDEMPLNDPIPRELSLDEIEDMKQHYFAAVRRLVEAGFDGVEVHAAHGYWMASFLTRVWNKRHDKYGIDSFENRTRLVREVMQGVRGNTPEGFLMGVRFNGIEFGNERAMTIEESVEIAKLLEAEGADYLSVTGEGYGRIPSPALYLPADYYPYPEPDGFMEPYIKDFDGLGTLVPAAAAIKKSVNVPVVCVGRLTPETAEEVLAEGMADIAGFNRMLWADPDMPNKLAQGKADQIRRCNRCGTCEGGGKIASMGPRTCRVNPALGRYDRDPHHVSANQTKRVLVIGGGPAGMETAATAAECGHQVTLVDSESRLGGHLSLASMIKGTRLDNVELLKDYLVDRITRLSVDVRLGVRATAEMVRDVNPDVVVVATGGRYVCQPAKGATKKNHTDVNALQRQVSLPLKLFGPEFINEMTKRILPGVGKNVVVVGTGIAGLQGALWLKKRGRNVTIVAEPATSDGEIADSMPPRFRNRLLPWFDTHGVDILPDVVGLEQWGNRLSAIQPGMPGDPGANPDTVIECDTALELPSMEADLELANALEKEGFRVLLAGSVKGRGNELIVDAVRDGREAGLAV